MRQTTHASNGDNPTMTSYGTPAAEEARSRRELSQPFVAPLWFPTDWRWLAADRVESGTASNLDRKLACQDKWVRRSVKYIRRRKAKESVTDYSMLIADEIRREDRLVQAELEGRLLASQSHAAIAPSVALEPEEIEAYENVFFISRNQDGILESVVHEMAHARSRFGFATHEVGAMWKLCGFNSLPLLEEMLSVVSREEVEMYGLAAYYRRRTSAPLSIRLAVALKCLHVGELSIEQAMHVALVAARACAKASEASRTWIFDVLAASGLTPRESQGTNGTIGEPMPQAFIGRLRRFRPTAARPFDPYAVNVNPQGSLRTLKQRDNHTILAEFDQ